MTVVTAVVVTVATVMTVSTVVTARGDSDASVVLWTRVDTDAQGVCFDLIKDASCPSHRPKF